MKLQTILDALPVLVKNGKILKNIGKVGGKLGSMVTHFFSLSNFRQVALFPYGVKGRKDGIRQHHSGSPPLSREWSSLGGLNDWISFDLFFQTDIILSVLWS
jgi:hypothetical protein